MNEHLDLEEIFQIAAKVEFDFSQPTLTYDGLPPLDIKTVIKFKEKKIQTEHVTIGKPNRNSLF